ncbi:hypothetical protein NY751_22235, partial [Xanthomonas campestris]|uniref:hypothetical protein n=1 Tax=Xanthomonas campestris TaxID=339 RepID=UPI002359CADD
KAPEMAKNPKIQTRLSGTMQHSALSNRIVQTFSSGLSQWLYATAAAMCGIGAFISLWRCDAEKKAADAGEIWIKRINDSLKSPTLQMT